VAQQKKSVAQSNAPVFLVTGGLGGVGNAYANYLIQNHGNCTLILTGRTHEHELTAVHKARLADLKSICGKVFLYNDGYRS